MPKRKIRSALLVDFDNVCTLLGHKRFVDSAPQWLAWLEDGQFDQEKRRRKFVRKIAYCNVSATAYQDELIRHAFDSFVCPSRIKPKKSTADMVIALDALQLTYERPRITEFVILSTDTDFVPLIEKLRMRSKRTIAVGNENNLSMSVYAEHSDTVIALQQLQEALHYQRQSGFWKRRRLAFSARLSALRPTTRIGPKLG